MLRKGFTLIELLIVITIIAILAGAAIPYVQDYVEDARFSKVRADLDEVKSALIRYELDTGSLWTNAETTLAKLIGPYLAKPLVDPWGTPYAIDGAGSRVYSAGPDRIAANGDDISTDFRPPLAISRAYWEDTNQNAAVDNGDHLNLRFTRPVGTVPAANAGFTFADATSITAYTHTIQADLRNVKTTLTTVATPFQAGRTLMSVTAGFLDTSATAKPANATNQVLIKAQ